MKNRWVLVADSTCARIFAEGDKGLELQQELVHPSSREHNQDLIGNRPNQNQHSMEKDVKGNQPDRLRDDASAEFAKELGNFLATAHSQNRFRQLVLIADPRFLGMLRKELSRPVEDAVTGSIDKRALQMRPAEVAELLEQAL
jgi:protein required for attachment to host cells